MLLRFVVVAALAVGACRQTEPHVGKPLLWKIERDGKTSFAFGTMHQGIDASTLAPIVGATLDGARAFAMETDLSQAAKMPVVRRDGSTLHGELGAAYWAKLEDALGADGASRVDGLRPMIAATLLSMRGLPETTAIDAALLARAQQAHKPVTYLEPIEAQFAVLDKWLDVRAIRDMLDDLRAIDRQSRDMLAAYVAGDDVAIVTISDRDRARWIERGRDGKEYDAQLEDLLYRRNASWIAEIERLHADGGAFIAVGAAHLVGPRSVLDLLSQRGYRVTRIQR